MHRALIPPTTWQADVWRLTDVSLRVNAGRNCLPTNEHSGKEGGYKNSAELGRRRYHGGIAANAGRRSAALTWSSYAVPSERCTIVAGLAQVRSLNFTNWFDAGILHTKLWVSDNERVYIGSANMDWRSLAQVMLHRCFFMTLTAAACAAIIHSRRFYR